MIQSTTVSVISLLQIKSIPFHIAFMIIFVVKSALNVRTLILYTWTDVRTLPCQMFVHPRNLIHQISIISSVLFIYLCMPLLASNTQLP